MLFVTIHKLLHQFQLQMVYWYSGITELQFRNWNVTHSLWPSNQRDGIWIVIVSMCSNSYFVEVVNLLLQTGLDLVYFTDTHWLMLLLEALGLGLLS